MAIGRIVWDRVTKRYRRNGTFVSKAAFRSQQYRLKKGGGSGLLQAERNVIIDRALRAEWGPPGGGLTWHQIATKYPERLEGYVDEIDFSRYI